MPISDSADTAQRPTCPSIRGYLSVARSHLSRLNSPDATADGLVLDDRGQPCGLNGIPAGFEAASSDSNDPFLILMVAAPKSAAIRRSRSAVVGQPFQSTSGGYRQLW